MKNISFFTLLIASLVTYAQPTITSIANSPKIGDLFEYVLTPNYSFDVNQSGANQTWDFSAASGNVSSYNYTDLASSFEPSTYPSSNLVESVPSAENYYTSSTNGITQNGTLFPGVVRVIYTDSRDLVRFPMSYTDSYTDNFSGTAENIGASFTADRSGTVVMTADGYGDLILPYATVPNVLRIQIVANYTDMSNGTLVGTYIDSIQLWYNPINNNFLASTTKAYTNGQLTISQAAHMEEFTFVNSLFESEATNELSIFPNPANDVITVSSVTPSTIQIYDITGKMILERKKASVNHEVSITDLSSGIYLVKSFVDEKVLTKKLVVE